MKRLHEGTIVDKVPTMVFVVTGPGVAELGSVDDLRQRYLRDRRSRLC